MDTTRLLAMLRVLQTAFHYAINALAASSIAFYGIMVGAWQILYRLRESEAIWYYYWFVFIHFDTDADVLEDADDVSEDTDDRFAG
jgi:hypothetical protein